MRKRLLSFFVVICLMLAGVLGLTACVNGATLETPVVTVDGSGIAKWNEVDNAIRYAYKIDGGAISDTSGTSVKLSAGQSISVKAVGNGIEYSDSAWSAEKTYTVCVHKDLNSDGKCDICSQTFTCANHIDTNGDYACDTCLAHIHADANGDDYCDNCQRYLIVVLKLYAVNDLHGMYTDSEEQPGVDELTTYLLDAQINGNSLFIASGDMWQGSTESNNTKGKLATEWLNYVNCSSMTLGNHEFDWTTEKIKINAQLAEFPFLAINVYERETDQRAPYCHPSTVVTLQGVKIGIIGAIGDCYGSISASMCRDVYFKTGSELTALVKEEATRLRNEEQVDYVVYSIHDRGVDSQLTDGYVDVVFEAHTHQTYAEKDSNGVWHVQGGGYNRGISEAAVNFNILTKQSNTTARTVPNGEYSVCASDTIINTLVTKYADEIGDPNEIIGHTDKYRSYEMLQQDMVNAYWQKGQEVWGANYKIAVAGGYISVRTPGSLDKGDITVKQIQTLFPFDNEMHLCSVLGSTLVERYFNNTSYVYVYDTEIRENLLNGIGLNDTYYIVTDSYNTDYAPNKLTKVDVMGGNIFPRDVLVEYIQNGGYGTGSVSPAEKTVEQINSIGNALDDNAETDVEYKVRGTIVNIENTVYGNAYIEDAAGNRLYIYGMYDKNGSVRYDALDDKPAIGDEVVLCGKIKKYVKSGEIVIEMMNGKIVKHTKQ
ncbi:MAG: hypothetical protein NC350_01365 [Corallococcus sp.]|nr:hypothetical protein [Corallococcus sp.]